MRALLGAGLALAIALLAACGGTTQNDNTDAGTFDAGCVKNPTTSLEILNACTDAGYLDKSPTLPLLLPDGGLPELP
ncbi:MAG: hypothetical protein JST92_11130 [Deltaproteobacteria bacterium]|nr:hypothetical protein [Deltaproteobacteria bacterium]